MHNGETMDVFAPFSALPGGALRLKDPDPVVEVDDSNTNKNNDNNSFELQQLDVMELAGGEEGIADIVDGFFDDFVALGDGDGMDAVMDGGDVGNIAEEGLAWLEDMDSSAFLPPPSALSSGEGALPSPVNEFEPLTVPTGVSEGSPSASAATPEMSERPTGLGSSPPECGEGPGANAVDTRTPATSVAPAGPSVGAPGAAPAAAVGVVVGGGDGRNGYGGGAVTIANGIAGFAPPPAIDVAACADRKEQLRKHKVARYLEKKKRRRWSKASASAYQSRQRVANNRPRHKGRFLPLESDFVPIAEMQRRQRALVKQIQDKKAAAARAAAAEAHQQSGMSPSSECGGQVAV